MADNTDLTLPLTPAKLGRAVDAIVEKAFPSPRGAECMPVGEMERALTALCGEAVQLAYNDATGIHRDARDRLARHLFLTDAGADRHNVAFWEQASDNLRSRYQRRADQILAVVNGKVA